jgi:hypothetical protein
MVQACRCWERSHEARRIRCESLPPNDHGCSSSKGSSDLSGCSGRWPIRLTRAACCRRSRSRVRACRSLHRRLRHESGRPTCPQRRRRRKSGRLTCRQRRRSRYRDALHLNRVMIGLNRATGHLARTALRSCSLDSNRRCSCRLDLDFRHGGRCRRKAPLSHPPASDLPHRVHCRLETSLCCGSSKSAPRLRPRQRQRPRERQRKRPR